MRVIERTVSNAFGRWMYRGDWRGVCIVLPRICVVLYWTLPGEAVASTTRRHELKHVDQAERYGFLGFWRRYLTQLWKNGYYLNELELEAQDAETAPKLRLVP